MDYLKMSEEELKELINTTQSFEQCIWLAFSQIILGESTEEMKKT
jgi:hypothetical protein